VGDFLFLQIAAAASGTARLFAESASATADPFLFVDPSFPNASVYSILVSPGVGNVPVPTATAPEPASVVLFALAVLFCAGARRLDHFRKIAER
jgi:hypothetical protein